MKKILILILTLVIIVLTQSFVFADTQHEKIIIITLDELDFKTSEKIINDNLSMGLLNIRTRGKNKESLFMSIARGRKVDIARESFKGLKKNNKTVEIEEYSEINKSLDRSYPNFSKQISSLGKVLNNNNINTSYIGEKNKSEILMIADDNGQIDYWKDRSNYDLASLIKDTKDMLELSDILLVSFDIAGDTKRVEILSSYLETMGQYKVIIFPKTVSGDMAEKLNDAIVPIFYGDTSDSGLLSSNSTKRDSVVSILDLMPTILSHYDLSIESNIGNNIEASKATELIEKNKDTLLEFLNLNLIKYIIHGLVVMLTLYIAYLNISKKRNFNKAKVLLSSVMISIPLSIILGLFNLHRYITIYAFLLIIISILLSIYLERKTNNTLEKISIGTNLLIIISIFLKPDFLYNSYIGYNSIVAGGRFYGFNNEMMGAFLITAIISYYYIKDKFKTKQTSNIFMISYFLIVIIALTGNFGANFGGFLTSIALFLILIYLSIFDRKVNKKTIISLLAIGLLILASNLYIDMTNDAGSHAGSLVERIRLLGFYEFIDMIMIKIKPLIYMTVVPPWSIGFLSQNYFIISKFRDMKRNLKPIPVEFVVMFITSFIVLIVNDTGVVAFVYMNTYLTSKILEER